MDIKQLGYFVRVAEYGSFSRAASSLQITQPALSKQIQNLETEFKEQLLIRNGRGVETTEVGARLFSHARELLQRVAETYADIDLARTGKMGKITIGMPATISQLLAVPVVRRLWDQLPGAQISIIHGRSNNLQDMMLDNKIDMSLMFNTPNLKALEITDIFDEALFLFGSDRHLTPSRLAALEMLAELPMIVGTRSHSVRSLLDAEMARAGLALNIVLELDNFESSFDLVRDGYGCTVTSMEIFRARDGRFDGLLTLPFAPAEMTLALKLVRPVRRPKNRSVDAAYQIVADVSREILTRG